MHAYSQLNRVSDREHWFIFFKSVGEEGLPEKNQLFESF